MKAFVYVKGVQLAHVKSHAGHPWNEAADAIANMFLSDDSTANLLLVNFVNRLLLRGFGCVR